MGFLPKIFKSYGEKDIPVLKTELKPIFTKALGRAEQ